MKERNREDSLLLGGSRNPPAPWKTTSLLPRGRGRAQERCPRSASPWVSPARRGAGITRSRISQSYNPSHHPEQEFPSAHLKPGTAASGGSPHPRRSPGSGRAAVPPWNGILDVSRAGDSTGPAWRPGQAAENPGGGSSFIWHPVNRGECPFHPIPSPSACPCGIALMPRSERFF